MSLTRGHLKIPWPTLRYLIGEGKENRAAETSVRCSSLAVMYGGRVIDSYDRRLIRTYMNEYFGDFVFDHFQPFHFFLDANKPVKYDYFIPEIRDFLSAKQRWLLKKANITVRSPLSAELEQVDDV